MTAPDAELAILRQALLEIAEVCDQHNSPGGMNIDAFIHRVVETMDRPEVKAYVERLKSRS